MSFGKDASRLGKRGADIRWGDPVTRFWKCVDIRGENECWPWKQALTNHKTHRYGRTNWNGRNDRAHRVAYKLTHGIKHLPTEVHICHTCDSPCCCNPKHLFRGDALANTRDRQAKGRIIDRRGPKNHRFGLHGEKSSRAKLTEAEAKQIHQLRKQGLSYTEIAKQVNVSRQQACSIVNFKNWPHLRYAL